MAALRLRIYSCLSALVRLRLVGRLSALGQLVGLRHNHHRARRCRGCMECSKDAEIVIETACAEADEQEEEEGMSLPIIFEHDISNVNEIVIQEAPQEITEEALETPIPIAAGPVNDPIGENEDGENEYGFRGWMTEDIDTEAEPKFADTLDRIHLLDPHHTITTLVSVNKMKGHELQKELKSRGLPTSGIKNKLINRLEKALANPGQLNEDRVELQAGLYDSESDTPEEDVGILLERRKKKLKPEIEEKRNKIMECLRVNTPIAEISQEFGCSISLVRKLWKKMSGGKAAKCNFVNQEISDLLDANVQPKDICKIAKCGRTTVFKVMRQKKYNKELATKFKGGKRTVRTEEFIEDMWSVVCSDPSKKMRRIAKEVSASRSTTRRAIREDLCLYPYKHRITQLIPRSAKPKRVKRGTKILTYIEENPEVVIIWTDEKTWDVDSSVNHQNDRYLSYCIESVPEKHRTTRPSGAMMLGVIASDGKVMPPLWIDKGTKVDSNVYIKNLEKVKAWIEDTYGDRPYVFMQDGAPSHVSEQTLAWMDQNLRAYWPPDMWPPYSPGMHNFDFSNI